LGKESSSEYQLNGWQRANELARPWLLLTGFLVLSHYELWWFAVPIGIGAVLAGFTQMHDAVHQSLGLSPRMNDFVLTMAGLLVLKSGHAVRITHLRHHGQCMGEDDPEGEPVKWTLREVFVNGPYHIFAMRFASLRIAPSTRTMQYIETAITFLILVAFVLIYVFTGSIVPLVYWSGVFLMSCTMPLWASYIPHRLSANSKTRLTAVKFARLWTPVISSFAFHHFHHVYPKIPTALLPKAAKELPEPDDDHDDHFHPH
jgi:fatty acid desaturase